jgi:hypothetical protein
VLNLSSNLYYERYVYIDIVWPWIGNQYFYLGLWNDDLTKIVLPSLHKQLSIISKWLAKHISTKVSFKITITKRHVNIDIGWPWIWNQYFYLGFWNDDRTKIIVLPSFQLVTRINSQNRNESEFINVIGIIILYMNIGISNWYNWSFDPRIWSFLLYFSSLQDFWTPSTWNPLVHTLWGEMVPCEKRAFQLLKIRKKICLNINSKCITDFFWVRNSRMEDYTCHYEVST